MRFRAVWKRRERRQLARRRSAASGAYTPVREHREHRRRASWRAQQVIHGIHDQGTQL